MSVPMIRSFVGMLGVLLFAGTAYGAEPCSACHTMHNSQNNAAVSGGAANPILLIQSTCLGCHARAAANDVTDHHFVLTTGADPAATQLAGGNFFWTEQGATDAFDRKAHNVSTLTVNNADDLLVNTPPGGAALTGTITCAGTTGCHGNRVETGANEMLDLGGAHHSNSAGQILGGGTTPGASYRFLKGIGGYEDADREFSVSSSDHNEYLGEARVGSDASSSTATVSYFCGNCHGNLHNGAGTISSGNNFSSPWVRHPTDYEMPNSSEYAAYYTAGYNTMAPVARADVPTGSSSTVATGANTTKAIVMCLSCHRAHGSAYDSILRWDYKAWPGDLTQDGCQKCHSTKN